MRDDFVPPATTKEQRDTAELLRLRQKNIAVRRWHALAVSMGYDGVEPALLSLQAMKRGPRRLSESKVAETAARYSCTECVWTGTSDQLDDDSQDWEICPACGANVIECKSQSEGASR